MFEPIEGYSGQAFQVFSFIGLEKEFYPLVIVDSYTQDASYLNLIFRKQMDH